MGVGVGVGEEEEEVVVGEGETTVVVGMTVDVEVTAGDGDGVGVGATGVMVRDTLSMEGSPCPPTTQHRAHNTQHTQAHIFTELHNKHTPQVSHFPRARPGQANRP